MDCLSERGRRTLSLVTIGSRSTDRSLLQVAFRLSSCGQKNGVWPSGGMSLPVLPFVELGIRNARSGLSAFVGRGYVLPTTVLFSES